MTYSKIDIGVEQLCRSHVKIEEENLKKKTKKKNETQKSEHTGLDEVANLKQHDCRLSDRSRKD